MRMAMRRLQKPWVAEMTSTPRRTVRIGGLWEEAQAAASERGENLSDVIRDALRAYIAKWEKK